MKVRLITALLSGLLVLMSGAGMNGAWADVFQTASFQLTEGEEEYTYSLFADAPATAAKSLKAGLPDGCMQSTVERLSADLRMRLLYRFECEGALKAGDSIYFPWRVNGADVSTSINGRDEQFSVIGARGGLEIPVHQGAIQKKSFTEIMVQFLWQGALHIWFGWDHLAFVMCLCMLASGLRLLELVSLFTVGHSISLGLSFFEVVSIPIPPVEAVIALSIVVMVREALVKGKGALMRRDQLKYSLVITVLGLIHGLGFASALGELGVSAEDRWPALIFFNIGIELGQLIFISVLVVLMGLLGRISSGGERALRFSALYGVGAIGAFWTIERVWGFGWA